MLGFFKWLFHSHKYKAIAVSHYYDVSYAPKGSEGAPSTTVTYHCKCGKLKTESLYSSGHLSLAQAQGKEEEDADTEA